MRCILNGIDVDSYNQETDASIFVPYNEETIQKKNENEKGC